MFKRPPWYLRCWSDAGRVVFSLEVNSKTAKEAPIDSVNQTAWGPWPNWTLGEVVFELAIEVDGEEFVASMMGLEDKSVTHGMMGDEKVIAVEVMGRHLRIYSMELESEIS